MNDNFSFINHIENVLPDVIGVVKTPKIEKYPERSHKIYHTCFQSLSYYVWGEDYEVQDTPWFYTEPDQPEKDSCVTYLNGYWYDESCSMPRTFFCVEGRYEGENIITITTRGLYLRTLQSELCWSSSSWCISAH